MNKIESTIGNARVNAGFKLIKGFKEGAFSVPGKGVISSDQSSSQYDPNWKTAIKTYAADILESLAIHVFEATLNTVDANAEDQSESDGESEGNPS
jgi:hypothetical protein